MTETYLKAVANGKVITSMTLYSDAGIDVMIKQLLSEYEYVRIVVEKFKPGAGYPNGRDANL